MHACEGLVFCMSAAQVILALLYELQALPGVVYRCLHEAARSCVAWLTGHPCALSQRACMRACISQAQWCVALHLAQELLLLLLLRLWVHFVSAYARSLCLLHSSSQGVLAVCRSVSAQQCVLPGW